MVLQTAPRRIGVQRTHLLRLIIYVVLECGFITFIVLARDGIPLERVPSESLTLAKGAFTIILVIWQLLAFAAAGEIVNQTFSSEWAQQLSKTGELVPGKTDRVSTLTAGVCSRAVYFFSTTSSRSFRFAFVASFAFFALSNIAPSTVRIDLKRVSRPEDLAVGNLTLTSDLNVNSFVVAERAWEIVHLDQVEGSSFGYDIQPNWVTAWPNAMSGNMTGEYTYTSDAASFRYTCHWAVPSFNNNTGVWQVGNASWSVWQGFHSGDDLHMPGIYPLLANHSSDQEALSAFLLLGRNTSINDDIGYDLAVDIDLSEVYRAEGLKSDSTANLSLPGSDRFPSNLALALLCDPNVQISGAEIHSVNNSLTVLSSGSAPVGNMPLPAVQYMFSHALLSVTTHSESSYGDPDVNLFAAQLLLNDTSPIGKGYQISRRPATIDTINARMDRFISLSSKAFLDGFQPGPVSSTVARGVSRSTVAAERWFDMLAIYTNRQLFIATITLIGLSILLLFALVFFPERHEPLTLRTILSRMDSERTPPNFLQRPVDKTDSISSGQEKDSFSSQGPFTHQMSTVSRVYPFATRQHSFAASIFMILELSFIALGLICLRNGEIVISHDPLGAITKGGFTVIVLLWQTIAIYIGRHVIFGALSAEWFLRFKTSGKLTPGQTDSVSALGPSGYASQASHFLLSGSASVPFRLTFILSLLLLSLSSIAPGSIQLLSQQANTSVPLDIGTLTLNEVLWDDELNFGAKLALPLQRARMISRLEQEESNVFGYSMEPNVLMAWPPTNLSTSKHIYTYPSDVVEFKYSCEWMAPTFGPNDTYVGGAHFIAGNDSWVLYDNQGVSATFPDYGSSNVSYAMLPLLNVGVPVSDRSLNGSTNQDPFSKGFATFNSSVIAVLVMGGQGPQYLIDLSDLPSSNTSQMQGFFFFGEDEPVPPRASLIVCEPSSRISGGSVLLDPSTQTLSVAQSGLPRVNNLPDLAINLTLSTCLLDVLSYPEATLNQTIKVNQAAAKLLLPENFAGIGTFKPLNGSVIAFNMESLVLSASKAFLDGYYAPLERSLDPTGNFSRMSVTATVNSVTLVVMSANKAFLFSTAGLLGAAAVFLLALFLRKEPAETFDLGHVLRELAADRSHQKEMLPLLGHGENVETPVTC